MPSSPIGSRQRQRHRTSAPKHPCVGAILHWRFLSNPIPLHTLSSHITSTATTTTTTPKMFTPRFRHHLLRSHPALRSSAIRAYNTTPALQQKDKKSNLLDKDSINTDSNEYSKSAGDASSAATEDAAFSTDKTRPEEQHDTAAREAQQQGVSGSPAAGVCADVLFDPPTD